MRPLIAMMFLLLSLAVPVRGQADAALETSVRVGLDASDRDTAFTLYDVGGRMRFEPWWRWGDGWSLGMSLVGSTGLLDDRVHTGLIVGLGPRLELRFPPSGWMLYIGSRASLLSRNKFTDVDLGGVFIFSNDLGIQYLLKDRFFLEYAFQHSSNARIYRRNPGVDFHVLTVGWRF